MYRCRSIDGTDFKFTLRNFWLRQKPLTLSSSSPLHFTRRSEYLTALNRLRCSGSPLKGSPCAPHPNPTQKFSSSEVVGCLNFEGKFLLSGLRLSAMLNAIFLPDYWTFFKTKNEMNTDCASHFLLVLDRQKNLLSHHIAFSPSARGI